MKHEIIKNNYIYIPEFVSRQEANVLAKEFQEYAVVNCAGDPQVPNSLSKLNFISFIRLLVKKAPEVSCFLGEDVLPTYTYSRVYKNGAVLERHRDRPACEISVTLNLSKSHDWPIYFQRSDGTETPVELEPGDAILYLGCVADHWRNNFSGEEYTQVFMHYVRAYGENSWAFFDKNKDASTQHTHVAQQFPKIEIKNKEWRATVL
jgi:hypothetical protein